MSHPRRFGLPVYELMRLAKTPNFDFSFLPIGSSYLSQAFLFTSITAASFFLFSSFFLLFRFLYVGTTCACQMHPQSSVIIGDCASKELLSSKIGMIYADYRRLLRRFDPCTTSSPCISLIAHGRYGRYDLSAYSVEALEHCS